MGLCLSLAGIAFLLSLLGNVTGFGPSPSEKAIRWKLQKENENFQNLKFDLVDPDQAPQEIRHLARQGFELMINTQKLLSAYAGDKLNCTNCHFNAGNTLGGMRGGISLAGVAAKYPAYSHKEKKVLDLPTRINNCFIKSMSGKALLLDSQEMLALITYLHWISKNFPIYETVPWLGLTEIERHYQPDSNRGKLFYNNHCALCHKSDGSGQSHVMAGTAIPPVWGAGSFNAQAGMAEQSTLTSFIFYNMPYPDAGLSKEQAADIAAYILTQPRTLFVPADNLE